jgi:hypothetical protein
MGLVQSDGMYRPATIRSVEHWQIRLVESWIPEVPVAGGGTVRQRKQLSMTTNSQG